MKEIIIQRILWGNPLVAHAFLLDNGMQVSIYGGTLTHIGAITIVDPHGNIATQQFEKHKDGVISEHWAKEILSYGHKPIVVNAGVHYDNLSKNEIFQVLDITEDMLKELLQKL